MSLVLAIQPDRDQATLLTAVCRRIGADLILAPSAPEALSALGDLVPDLVLTAPFVSAHDEAIVSEHLRGLGAAALHVQSIAAPFLGETAPEPPRPRGFLAALAGRKPDVFAPAACDPNTFAEQISGYLLRAVAERTALDVDALHPGVAIDEPWYLVGARDEDTHGAGERASDDLRSDRASSVRDAIEAIWRAGWLDAAIAPGQDGAGARPEARAALLVTPEPLLLPSGPHAEDDGRASWGASRDHEPAPAAVTAVPAVLQQPPLVVPATERQIARLIGGPDIAARARQHFGPPPPPRRLRRTKRARRHVVLEESAYFDPARCPFATLVAAFDALANTDPGVSAARK